MRRSVSRLRSRVPALTVVALFMLGCFLGATTSPAFAHAALLDAIPAAGYSVSDSPHELALDFADAVSIQASPLTLHGPQGAVPLSGIRLSQGSRRLQAGIGQLLVSGQYQVHWQVTSADGDVVHGTYYFGVGDATQLASGESLFGSGNRGTATIALLRWGLFAGLALALGGHVADRLLVAKRQPVDAAAATSTGSRPAPAPLVAAGAIVGAVATIGLGLQLRGGGSVVKGLLNRQGSLPLSTVAGRVLVAELTAFLLTVLLLRLARKWPSFRSWAAAALGVVVVAEGFRGHPEAAAPGVGALVTMTHLAAAAIWVGALIHVLRVAHAWRADRLRVRTILAQYAQLALVLVAVVVVSGVLAALAVVSAPSDLYRSGYGETLLIKIAVVAAVVTLAAIARKRLHARRVEDDLPGWAARGEAVGLIGVLAVTALLVSLAPPSDSRAANGPPPTPTGPTVPTGLLVGQLSVGVIASSGRIDLTVTAPGAGADDQGGGPNPRYRALATFSSGAGDDRIRLRVCGPGCFTAPVTWGRGLNTIALSVQASGWRGGTADVAIPWPPLPDTTLLPQAIAATRAIRSMHVNETVTSDSSHPPVGGAPLAITGEALLASESYGTGATPPVVVVGNQGGLTEIAFAYPEQGVFYHLYLRPDHLIARETEATPDHEISNIFSYP